MRRNLDRRVEAVTPIESPKLKKQLEKIIDLYLKDNWNAWEMQSDGTYILRQAKGEVSCAQHQFMANNHK